ncbi:cytochrome P450 family protein [Ceratobasidium sp. AG-Ba]|nr:cytochrome P450 family protein [Ceratobasidium sp. AG-Ba]
MYEDPAVHSVEDIVTRLCELFTPGAKPPVEDLPWLGYFPNFMSPWKSKAKRVGEVMEMLYEDLADIAWDRGVSGQNTNTLAYKFRMDEQATGLTRRQQAFACGIALEGGSDIVAGAILSCILALVHDPDSYENYTLPKDSTIICNIWAIHSNPERYEDPEVFKPERFLEHKMSAAESIAQGDPFKRDHFAFGAGRRSCPGVQIAEQGIFIALSRLLWAFEFSAPPGTTVNVDQSAWTGETVRIPKKFPLVIKPRSARRTETIEQEIILVKESVYSQYGVYKNPDPEQ